MDNGKVDSWIIAADSSDLVETELIMCLNLNAKALKKKTNAMEKIIYLFFFIIICFSMEFIAPRPLLYLIVMF